MQARAPERLVGVDVADAGDQPLVEQRAFDSGPTAAHRRDQRRAIERRIEQVACDVPDGDGHEGRGRAQAARGAVGHRHEPRHGEVTERALVDVAQLRPVIEDEAYSQVRRGRHRGAGVAHEQLATHPEVGHQR